MNIQEMKEKKKEKGYTNEQIAELSGVWKPQSKVHLGEHFRSRG